MKREREPACPVCGHYHKWEEGETCGICGHRPATAVEKAPSMSAFPSEVIPKFLYLGSYDHASRCEVLKIFGIKYILNAVPGCQNLYKNSFTYYNVTAEGKLVPLPEAVEFLRKVELEQSKVLVHCMTGNTRSASVVIAYLMQYRQWSYPQSLQFVSATRPSVKINPEVHQQLLEREFQLFGKNFDANELPPVQLPSPSGPLAPQGAPGAAAAASAGPFGGPAAPPCPLIAQQASNPFLCPGPSPPLFTFGSRENPQASTAPPPPPPPPPHLGQPPLGMQFLQAPQNPFGNSPFSFGSSDVPAGGFVFGASPQVDPGAGSSMRPPPGAGVQEGGSGDMET